MEQGKRPKLLRVLKFDNKKGIRTSEFVIPRP